MARVDVYTTPSCPFCVRAKRLLQARGIPYREIDVGGAPDLRADLIRRTGRRTVPQIFIDGDPIGSCHELFALDSRGALAMIVPPESAF